MGKTTVSETQARTARDSRYRRHVMRLKRLRRLALVLALLSGTAGVAVPVIESQPVFRVRLVQLYNCPDTLRAPVAKVVRPLLGRSLFEASQQRKPCRAALRTLPEVADVRLVCRAPHAVEVRVTPRVASYTLKQGKEWLAVEANGRILRVDAKPAAGLLQLFGVEPGDGKPGGWVKRADLRPVERCVKACQTVLGAPPAALELSSAGALRLRTAHGDNVVLGQASGLNAKLEVFAAVRGKLSAPARYIDVSVPSAPVCSVAVE